MVVVAVVLLEGVPPSSFVQQRLQLNHRPHRVVLGGLGTAYGALIGALIVGIVVEASSLWIPADLKFASGLFILIVILLFRPQGILGRRERIG